jgi:hypothetical protein
MHTTGAFPYPITVVGFSAAPDQRVKVLDSDLDPALHPGALYWAETQYVAADDAAANNGLNNASYRDLRRRLRAWHRRHLDEQLPLTARPGRSIGGRLV